MADDHTPLPENKFTFRRLFSYVIATWLMILLSVLTNRIDDPVGQKAIAFYVMILLWWVITYYMVAPSAEQIARIIQAARIFQSSSGPLANSVGAARAAMKNRRPDKPRTPEETETME